MCRFSSQKIARFLTSDRNSTVLGESSFIEIQPKPIHKRKGFWKSKALTLVGALLGFTSSTAAYAQLAGAPSSFANCAACQLLAAQSPAAALDPSIAPVQTAAQAAGYLSRPESILLTPSPAPFPYAPLIAPPAGQAVANGAQIRGGPFGEIATLWVPGNPFPTPESWNAAFQLQPTIETPFYSSVTGRVLDVASAPWNLFTSPLQGQRLFEAGSVGIPGGSSAAGANLLSTNFRPSSVLRL